MSQVRPGISDRGTYYSVRGGKVRFKVYDVDHQDVYVAITSPDNRAYRNGSTHCFCWRSTSVVIDN